MKNEMEWTQERREFSPIDELYEEDEKIPSSIDASRQSTRNDGSPFIPPSTPNTLLTMGDVEIKPDLTLKCTDCNIYVEMCHLLEHRRYHQALRLLQFPANKPPQSVKEVTARRSELLRGSDKSICWIREVNSAHDTAKAHIEQTAECTRQFDDAKLQEFINGTGLDCSCNCVLAVGVCSDGNSRYRAVMEDRRVYQDYFGNDSGKAFLGLYDGHSGCFAAEVAANEMHHVLLQQLIRFDPQTTCTCTVNMITDEVSTDYDDNRPCTARSERVALHYASSNMVHSIIHTCQARLALPDQIVKQPVTETNAFSRMMTTAFVTAYHQVDQYLSYGIDERSRIRWSGCSALTILVKDNETESDEPKIKKLGDIHLAQAGEVRAILVRGGKAYSLTKDHSLSNSKERNRIIKSGGVVTGQNKTGLRLNGIIFSTRGLGNHGDPKLKKCIRVDPYTGTVPIDEYAECLILASRGVSEIFSDKEAAQIVKQLLPRYLLPPPSWVSPSMRSLLGLHSQNSPALDTPVQGPHTDLRNSTPGESLVTVDTNLTTDPTLETDYAPKTETEIDSGSESEIPVSRPNTGKSSGVSFRVEQDVVEYADEGIRSFSAVTSDEFGRNQLRRDLAREMSERLTNAAIMAGAMENITVMVVLFPGSGL